jgi:hypothetical protein
MSPTHFHSRASKNFFFEKKKQKTFDSPGPGAAILWPLNRRDK